MLKATQILVRSIALAACAASIASLSACGQKGPLFLPTDPAAQGRATLPEALGISSPKTPGTAAPVVKPSPLTDSENSAETDAKP
ncbi:MAG: lipoprotein [Comamonas sp.]